MFNWDIWHFYPLNELIKKLMPATGLKKAQILKTSQHFRNSGLSNMYLRMHLKTIYFYGYFSTNYAKNITEKNRDLQHVSRVTKKK